ncbi:MAG TPA: nucleotidyl transferase AbiEii/AbiGii toxin family protein [Gemmatimonadota bacterium]|nr:nucleotidyl transferase AbiEii/AbiGii toxin family protein [Gemmatimonadota bacterium]
MTEPDLVGLFVEPLERSGLAYMVTGGVASVVYGDPRFTRDVDVVVEVDPAQVEDLLGVFAGGSLYVPSRDVVDREVRREEGGHFDIIDPATGLRADVYLSGRDPLHAWALERRRRVDLGDRSIWLAPIEYVLVRKLQYYRMSGSDRHLRDAAMILRISGDQVEDAALEEWTRRLGVEAELQEARRFQVD